MHYCGAIQANSAVKLLSFLPLKWVPSLIPTLFADEKLSIAHSRFFVKAICVGGSTLFVLMYICSFEIFLNMAWQSLKSPKCSKSRLIYVFFWRSGFYNPQEKGSWVVSTIPPRIIVQWTNWVCLQIVVTFQISRHFPKTKTYGTKSLPSRELTNTSYIPPNGKRKIIKFKSVGNGGSRAHTIHVYGIYLPTFGWFFWYM